MPIFLNRKRTRTVFCVIFALFTIFAILLLSSFSLEKGTKKQGSDSPVSCLVCGIDDAGANTDVMLLCTLDSKGNQLGVLQIPRDTLVLRENGKPTKINSLYATFLAKTSDRSQAAYRLRDEISSLFAVRVDHVFFLNMDTVAALVDDMGGLTLEVPRNITSRTGSDSISIPQGTTRLDGKGAVDFLRYRQGYIQGDIDRLDAQKLFFVALFREMRNNPPTFGTLLKAGRTLLSSDIFTDLNLLSAGAMASDIHGLLGEESLHMATLPGEALYMNGCSYYVACRAGTDALLSHAFSPFYGGEEQLDREGRLCYSKDLAIKNAYYNPSRAFKLYTPKDAAKLVKSLAP